MRKLKIVDEFRVEAANSLFNKAQAMAITVRLLQMELASAENSAEDKQTLSNMLSRFSFEYLDRNHSVIDVVLDDAGVARLTCEDILKAVDAVRFDVE